MLVISWDFSILLYKYSVTIDRLLPRNVYLGLKNTLWNGRIIFVGRDLPRSPRPAVCLSWRRSHEPVPHLTQELAGKRAFSVGSEHKPHWVGSWPPAWVGNSCPEAPSRIEDQNIHPKVRLCQGLWDSVSSLTRVTNSHGIFRSRSLRTCTLVSKAIWVTVENVHWCNEPKGQIIPVDGLFSCQ